ncbi:Chromo domain-like [Phytophthora cactorum]|nr:Chromo domain-like [Phytophthora cactorum]
MRRPSSEDPQTVRRTSVATGYWKWAWLYMERVKPGLTKKLAHRWHGPFRIKRKAVNEFPSRPRTQLTHNVTEESRLDFDEELLPEDSWEPDRLAGEFEVEAILDDRMPLSTSTERSVREFKVKWVGYENRHGNQHPIYHAVACLRLFAS